MNKDFKFMLHRNDWWWGKTAEVVSTDGCALVELIMENDSNVAVVNGLLVFPSMRNMGYATEMMRICEEVAREDGRRFLQLYVDKNKIWLSEWYERLGFVKIYTDEHEHSMMKLLV